VRKAPVQPAMSNTGSLLPSNTVPLRPVMSHSPPRRSVASSVAAEAEVGASVGQIKGCALSGEKRRAEKTHARRVWEAKAGAGKLSGCG
jgi:hypothetical protein